MARGQDPASAGEQLIGDEAQRRGGGEEGAASLSAEGWPAGAAAGNRKAAAWDAIGAAYWNAGYRGGPTDREIELYLDGLRPAGSVLVVGASTRHLIDAAVRRGADVTVLDFSPGMCAALAADVGTGRCDIVSHDITTPIPAGLCQRFELVLADRLLNRFVERELRGALHQMLALLRDDGEVRTSIRVGLYQRDLPLIEAGRRRGTLHQFFDEATWEIDYGAAGDLLDDVLPDHGSIPRDVLLTFYRLRGREKRLRPEEIERFVSETTDGRRSLRLARVRPMIDTTEDSLYVFVPMSVGT